ncbi:hypothetical protein GCM10025880_66020 [Methylorubrum aminovorans]|uniref:ParA family protein n=1 Tax=Methylorubrum aminovorans TaxID=269069 RepID=UPI0023E93D5B|nr:ParA family protein [Methylorubrum aminovorans]GMA80185.1 hypothetical protein GCM10025880_66020 [Methylorubrum aminovorans]
MNVIAFVTQKGGTGKSSLAVSLAVAAEERGIKTSIIDLDPQGTAKNWYERREAEGAPRSTPCSPVSSRPPCACSSSRGSSW